MIDEADIDKDGEINFDDFKGIMEKCQQIKITLNFFFLNVKCLEYKVNYIENMNYL